MLRISWSGNIRRMTLTVRYKDHVYNDWLVYRHLPEYSWIHDEFYVLTYQHLHRILTSETLDTDSTLTSLRYWKCQLWRHRCVDKVNGIVYHALYIAYHALCIAYHALCIAYHALCIAYHALCIAYHILCIAYHALCIAYRVAVDDGRFRYIHNLSLSLRVLSHKLS